MFLNGQAVVFNDLKTKVKDLSDRQTESDKSRRLLEAHVDILESELKDYRENSNDPNTTKLTYAQVLKNVSNLSEPSKNGGSTSDLEVKRIVDHAKKVIGLYPVEARDIKRQGSEHSVEI